MQDHTSPRTNGINILVYESIRRGRTFLLDQYLSSLVGILFAIPIVASIITVTFYIISPLSSWYAVLWGSAVTCAIWLCIAFPLSHFTTASGANKRSYNLLVSQLSQLKTRLDALKEQEKLPDNSLPKCSQIALKEVEAGYTALHESLITTTGDLRWISGIGYLDAWATLHQAEEALIEVEPLNMVLDSALYDARRIQNAAISDTDKLLNQLVQAVQDLDPAAMAYFKDCQREKVGADLQGEMQQQTRGIMQIAKALKTVHPDMAMDLQGHELPVVLPIPDEETRTRARVALRQIRHTINDFRDTSWDGLLRVRNHLMFAMILTGLVTYMLLCLVIISRVDSTAVTAATFFYIIGAIAGMFGRFYREANTHIAVNDYGLTTMRLFAIPLLSGLAGIGGAFITLILPDSLSSSAVIKSSELVYSSPQLLLAAAIFGLAPNLIIKSLQQKAEKYASNLKSSKSTE